MANAGGRKRPIGLPEKFRREPTSRRSAPFGNPNDQTPVNFFESVPW
jgi:hypothetical protein